MLKGEFRSSCLCYIAIAVPQHKSLKLGLFEAFNGPVNTISGQ